MAFCENCGAKLEEGAKFCDSCGNPVNEESDPKKSGNGKLIGIICGAAGAAVLAVVLILVLVLGGSGYSSAEDAAEAYVQAYIDCDAEGMLDCYPDFLFEYLEDEFDMDRDDMIDDLEDEFDDMEDMDEVKIKKVKVKKDGDDLDDLPSKIEDAMSKDDKKAFEEWAKVEVKVDFDGKTTNMTIYCICLDGSWYVLNY